VTTAGQVNIHLQNPAFSLMDKRHCPKCCAALSVSILEGDRNPVDNAHFRPWRDRIDMCISRHFIADSEVHQLTGSNFLVKWFLRSATHPMRGLYIEIVHRHWGCGICVYVPTVILCLVAHIDDMLAYITLVVRTSGLSSCFRSFDSAVTCTIWHKDRYTLCIALVKLSTLTSINI